VPRTPKHSDEELLMEIALAPDPFVTATELASRTDYSRDGALKRLEELEGKGWVRSRTVGANAVVWWLTTPGRDRLS
jgi:DNA-binding MarR family transcriptional regulator